MTVLMHITTARRRLNARALAILQTAVAALAAWYLCIPLLPDEKPVFACIARHRDRRLARRSTASARRSSCSASSPASRSRT